jgi:hypothetical protein
VSCDSVPRKGEQLCCKQLWLTPSCLWRFLHGCQQCEMLHETLQRRQQGHCWSTCQAWSRTVTTECNSRKLMHSSQKTKVWWLGKSYHSIPLGTV